MPSSSSPPRQRYLLRQHRRWWARFVVPADVSEAFEGKGTHWVNLQTEDRKIAEARCHRAASDFFARVAEARGRAGTIEGDALAWRRLIEADEDGVAVDAAIREASNRYVRGGHTAVQKAANLFHEGIEGDALLDLGGPKAETFVAIAIHGRKPLLPFVEPWQAVRLTEVEGKTASMDKAVVNNFVRSFPLATDVTKAKVANWIESRKTEVTASSVQREVSGLRSFWGYLRARQEVPEDVDPFAGQKFKDRRKDLQRLQRVDFTAPEVAALYGAALKAKDQQLADLIAMAAYTGARREELCSLKIEDVTKGWINIKDAKTDAGNRDVPIHAAVAPTFKRLIGKRASGYVLEGTGEDKWGNRGDALGKRFTRLKGPKTEKTPNGMGFGPDKTFHSIRHAFGTLLRSKGVEEPVVAALMGHTLTSDTFGRYGKRGGRELLPGALRKLKYPKPL